MQPGTQVSCVEPEHVSVTVSSFWPARAQAPHPHGSSEPAFVSCCELTMGERAATGDPSPDPR